MVAVRGKTAIVTGGANGIGFQYCVHLLRNGAKIVAILDLPNSNGEASVSKLTNEFGAGCAIFFPSDVTKFDELEVAFKNAVKALGGLDILINNAGIADDAHWQKEIDINFTAVVKSTLLGYDFMGTHKGGEGGIIVNISSIVGLIRYENLPIYTATKHAVLAFTVSLKHSFERTGVSVRVMCPGVTNTPLITDIDNKHLDFIDNAVARENLLAFHRQSTEHVAKSVIALIEKGTNGSVWISQMNEPPFEIELATYDCVKL